ncbi:hypothetical protein ZIOFF_050993 [Zingiber officinale]|uniref:RRM domain-containing protein n=1 Tax=Zingiber officinale TaxID=94328 RepID=A0A8J5FSJ9_ZINOF|nr:hypothetical protein ZIOFF_050993 [Zingiber officinale]
MKLASGENGNPLLTFSRAFLSSSIHSCKDLGKNKREIQKIKIKKKLGCRSSGSPAWSYRPLRILDARMPFANRIDNLLKKSVTSSPLFQAARRMSSSKIFVGGLSYGTDDESLREVFTSFGEVVEARVIMDKETERSRGFRFMTFTSSEEASATISGIDGKDVHG